MQDVSYSIDLSCTIVPHLVEDIWLEGKKFLRKYWCLCKYFRAVKKLLELFYKCSKFDFPKIHNYHFSQEIK